MKNTATDKKTDHSTDSTHGNPQEEAQSKQQPPGAPPGGNASTLHPVAPRGRVEVDFSASTVALKNGKKLCCKNNEELNLKLCSENTTLENQLKKLSKHFEEKVNTLCCIHSVAKVYAVFPFYDVKCLCSGGWE